MSHKYSMAHSWDIRVVKFSDDWPEGLCMHYICGLSSNLCKYCLSVRMCSGSDFSASLHRFYITLQPIYLFSLPLVFCSFHSVGFNYVLL